MRQINTIALITAITLITLTSCTDYSSILKSANYEYRYEAAKEYFIKGQYNKSTTLLTDIVTTFKGTSRGEECLYMLAMSEYCNHNYDVSYNYFKKYYQTYPKGTFVEYARYYAGRSLYESVPDTRLDQTCTADAVKEFQNFLDYYPYTKLKAQTQQMIFALQDKMVEKEYQAAKLYYDLGNYMGNCSFGGSNFEACIVTARNTLLDYPYASPQWREEISILILRAKYQLAIQSVDEKQLERYKDTIDEYYGFLNEYPESKYLKDAQKIYIQSEKFVNKNS